LSGPIHCSDVSYTLKAAADIAAVVKAPAGATGVATAGLAGGNSNQHEQPALAEAHSGTEQHGQPSDDVLEDDVVGEALKALRWGADGEGKRPSLALSEDMDLPREGGGFGCVWLHCAKDCGGEPVVVAVKTLRPYQVTRQQLWRMHSYGVPRLVGLSSPWLVQVKGSIAEGQPGQPDALHLVMEALVGDWVRLDAALIVPRLRRAMLSGLKLKAQQGPTIELVWEEVAPSGPFLQRLLLTFVEVLKDFNHRSITYADSKPQNLMLHTQQVLEECGGNAFLAIPWVQRQSPALQEDIQDCLPRLHLQQVLPGQVAARHSSNSGRAGEAAEAQHEGRDAAAAMLQQQPATTAAASSSSRHTINTPTAAPSRTLKVSAGSSQLVRGLGLSLCMQQVIQDF
jgi:hypothetical protein